LKEKKDLALKVAGVVGFGAPTPGLRRPAHISTDYTYDSCEKTIVSSDESNESKVLATIDF
jgi:hypothetical protein